MQKTSRHFLLCFFLWSASISAAPNQAPELWFEHITVENGLPVNVVKWILQDRLGFLWFSTQNGLTKYDGNTFTTYAPEPNNPGSLSDRDLMELLEDRAGNLWIGTVSGGLNLFHRETETFTHFRHDESDPSSLGHDGVFTLYEDRAGALWIGTGGGLDRFDPKTRTFTHFVSNPDDPHTLSHPEVYAICEDRAGNLWIGTREGLNKLDAQSGALMRYLHDPKNPNSLSHDLVGDILEDADGNLWIATMGGGLNRFVPETNTFKHYRHDSENPKSLGHDYVFNLYEDRRGNFWVGTSGGGLDWFDRQTETFAHYKNDPNAAGSLSSNAVRFIFEDRSDVLWVGCWYTGLNKVNAVGGKFRHHRYNPDATEGLSNNWVWALCEDRQGMVWIGTEGGGLNRFNPEKRTFDVYQNRPQDATSLSHNVVRTLCIDRADNLWIGTADGLNRFNRKQNTFTRFAHNPEDSTSLSGNFISSICEDRSGALWVGTSGRGLNRRAAGAKAFTHFRHDPDDSKSLSSDWITTLYEDRSGALWIGTPGQGLNKWDAVDQAFVRYRDVATGLTFIVDLYEDTAGRFWIATFDGGLHLFDRASGKSKPYTERDGLPHISIKAIEEDDAGNLWISSDRGLSRFEPQNVAFRNYAVNDGLQGSLFNMQAACKGRDGSLYFGGVNGFNRFHPDRLVDNLLPPQVVLTEFKIFNQTVLPGKNAPLKTPVHTATHVQLAHWQHDISIGYAALHFASPERNTYAYMLEGYDADWRPAGSQRVATFTSLDPGTYVFRVKAANGDGVWSTQDATLHITVAPAIWQAWWFRFLVVFSVVSTAGTGYKRRVSKIEMRRKELEQRVEERTRAAEALQNALDEVERLKNRLHAENIYLQGEIKLEHNFEHIITGSKALKQVLRTVEQVAATEATVLILGESGTGKELFARAVHNISPRSDRPLVKVNCAALPANLIESELFGHEKGAFTGAVARKIGRFELADGGTIFLDEIGELPLELQAKLLRVLQEGEFERLGDTATLHVDVRVLAATNRDLAQEVAEGRFREDLYYRLNVFPIRVPPLRERKEDIPLLVKHFIQKYGPKFGRHIETVPQPALDVLQTYHWPGNVRELENIVERAVIITTGNQLMLGDWFPQTKPLQADASPLCTLEENERAHILRALEMTGGRVSGKQGAAELLGINPKTLYSRIQKLNLPRKSG